MIKTILTVFFLRHGVELRLAVPSFSAYLTLTRD